MEFFSFNSYSSYLVAGNSDAVNLEKLFPGTQYMLTVSAVWSGRKYRSRAIIFRTMGDIEGVLFQVFSLIFKEFIKNFPNFPDISLLPQSSPQQDMPLDNNSSRLYPALNSHSKESNYSSNMIRELPTVNF